MTWLERIEYAVANVVRRIVAIRNWRVSEAARRLSTTHSALWQWVQRFRVPT